MKTIILIAGLLCLTIQLPAVPVFIGTNTGKNTASKGIYLPDFQIWLERASLIDT